MLVNDTACATANTRVECAAPVPAYVCCLRIAAVPEWLGELESLRLLDLGHNALGSWEQVDRIAAVPNLVQLTLKGCPISGVVLAPCDAADKVRILLYVTDRA